MKTQSILKIALVFIAVVFMNFKNASVSEAKNKTMYDTSFSTLNDYEEELEIEDWMTDDSVWKIKDEKNTFKIQPVNEEKLVVEDWMSDDEFWRYK